MKLFWKLFCSMVSVSILACAVGGFVLIDGQFRAALEQEMEVLRGENDMLRYALFMEAEGRVLSGREELARLAQGMSPTTGGHTISFRISAATGEELGGNHCMPPELNPSPLISGLLENQRCCMLRQVAEGAYYLHGASAVSLQDETVYLENCRYVSPLFAQRAGLYRSFTGVMLALIAGAAVLSFILARAILLPLDRLSAVARIMAAGELSRRVPVTSDDELGLLFEDFNAMAERLEEQMAQLTDAARREKDFTASFAHEIKTPLTSIIGYADLLRSRPATEEQVRESAGYIFGEGRRLEALSRKLLDLIVLGRQDFPLRPVPLDAFLRRVAGAMEPPLRQAGIRLTLHSQAVTARMEPDLMETVCMNLLDNARKAMEDGGEILLEGFALEDGSCCVQVADQGKGIPAEELERVTEAFYMVDKSRARAQGGAGLGLALCRRIVELHGGTLEIESEPGRGTRVRVLWKGGEELPCETGKTGSSPS